MSETRYWIGVASREHVLRGVAGGFCQLNHGKSGPIRRLSPGDWIVYYSPRESMNEGEPVQAFTAIGEIAAGEPYVGEMGGGIQATRRGVRFLKATDAPIRPLLDVLSFTRGRVSWGYAFRRGSFAIDETDFRIIAKAMGVGAKV
ncbi:MAG TPA: EVE domain-containing protein [Bauldia sp.]|nr:EVE domain-containing protein [Bauldia sp.]